MLHRIIDDKFNLEELAIRRVALMLHHGPEGGINTDIDITTTPQNKDSKEGTFGPTLPALCLEQRCGMMRRDVLICLGGIGSQLNSKAQSRLKSGPLISEDYTKSHPGLA